MRHRKANVKLGRTASHRRAMLRNMATSLFEYGKITTTLVKAKAVRPVIDRLVTLAKKGDLHSIRLARTLLTKPTILKKLFNEAKEDKFGGRCCGYASMVRVGLRAGDTAPLVRLELLTADSAKPEVGRAPRKSLDRERRVAATRAKGQDTAKRDQSAPEEPKAESKAEKNQLAASEAPEAPAAPAAPEATSATEAPAEPTPESGDSAPEVKPEDNS